MLWLSLCLVFGGLVGYASAGGLQSAPVPDDVVNEPRAVGPPVTVAKGSTPGGTTWTLTAFESDRGLCLNLEGVTKGNLGGGACGLEMPEGNSVTFVDSFFGEPNVTLVYGLAGNGVESVVVEEANGDTLGPVTVKPSPSELGFAGGFFATAASGAISVESVVAAGSSAK